MNKLLTATHIIACAKEDKNKLSQRWMLSLNKYEHHKNLQTLRIMNPIKRVLLKGDKGFDLIENLKIKRKKPFI
jgi:hypothetical protein